MDIIFAFATAVGRAGVSVLRLSGQGVFDALKPVMPKIDADRRTPYLTDFHKIGGEVIDTPLVLGFAKGASFTGEETVELHLHGSPAIQKEAILILSQLPNMRMAEPGEFTRRALINGRMTLEEVEGLADLIDAETESQAIQARKLLNGHLKTAVADWRTKLIHAGALLQATIDFADEEVPVDVFPEVSEILLPLRAELEAQARGVVVSERVRSGFEVAIIGQPNAGKSTFINALARRDVAIVTDVAGTTRDVLEVDLDLRGHSVRVLDTAGIRATDDSVEKIGVERALDRAASADLRIWLKTPNDDVEPVDMTADDLIVTAKDDEGVYDNGLSGKTGHGIDRILNHIGTVLNDRVSRVGVATLERHGIAITNAVGYLDTALFGLENGQEVELVADDLRAATRQLDRLIGHVDVEDVLDKVFSSFCLGK